MHLKTNLENEQDSVDRRKYTSVKSLPRNLFEENIQRSRQEFNPSHTKEISKSYELSDDQLKLNQRKISNVTPLDESLSYSYDTITSQSDIMSSNPMKKMIAN